MVYFEIGAYELSADLTSPLIPCGDAFFHQLSKALFSQKWLTKRLTARRRRRLPRLVLSRQSEPRRSVQEPPRQIGRPRLVVRDPLGQKAQRQGPQEEKEELLHFCRARCPRLRADAGTAAAGRRARPTSASWRRCVDTAAAARPSGAAAAAPATARPRSRGRRRRRRPSRTRRRGTPGSTLRPRARLDAVPLSSSRQRERDPAMGAERPKSYLRLGAGGTSSLIL